MDATSSADAGRRSTSGSETKRSIMLGGGDVAVSARILLWPNGCIEQDATWYRFRPRLREIVLDGDRAPLP